MRNPYGNVAAPAEGYIWDACARAGVSFRSYGEFVEDPGLEEGTKPRTEGSRRRPAPAAIGSRCQV